MKLTSIKSSDSVITYSLSFRLAVQTNIKNINPITVCNVIASAPRLTFLGHYSMISRSHFQVSAVHIASAFSVVFRHNFSMPVIYIQHPLLTPDSSVQDSSIVRWCASSSNPVHCRLCCPFCRSWSQILRLPMAPSLPSFRMHQSISRPIRTNQFVWVSNSLLVLPY